MNSRIMIPGVVIVILCLTTVIDVSGETSLSSELDEDDILEIERLLHGEKREENGEGPPPNKVDSLSKNEKREDENVEPPPPDTESLDTREFHLLRAASSFAVCIDFDKGCTYWAGVGECCVNTRYMHVYCKKSCNLCGGCTDLSYNCENWKSSCSKNTAYMHVYCKKTCGIC